MTNIWDHHGFFPWMWVFTYNHTKSGDWTYLIKLCYHWFGKDNEPKEKINRCMVS